MSVFTAALNPIKGIGRIYNAHPYATMGIGGAIYGGIAGGIYANSTGEIGTTRGVISGAMIGAGTGLLTNSGVNAVLRYSMRGLRK